VLLHLAEHGVEVDGIDLAPAMLARLRAKAAEAGWAVNASLGDMREFALPRRYARVFLAFNGFAHCHTTEDQIRCLSCCLAHLEPGGALVLHVSYPGVAYWSAPDTGRVLEMEVAHPETGLPVRMYDTRTKHRVEQFQDSVTDIEEQDGRGGVLRSHRFETRQRWVYRWELELLLRCAGFSRWEIVRGWDGGPFEREDQPMIAYGWRDR
jgi:SAM-dependent methyltransferase